MELCSYVSHSDPGLKSNHYPYYFSTDYYFSKSYASSMEYKGATRSFLEMLPLIHYLAHCPFGECFSCVNCIYLHSRVIVYLQDNLIMSFNPNPKFHLELIMCMRECIRLCMCVCTCKCVHKPKHKIM